VVKPSNHGAEERASIAEERPWCLWFIDRESPHPRGEGPFVCRLDDEVEVVTLD
jgi:hypothetical protein